MTRREIFFHELATAGIQLNASQRKAVTHTGGPLVVFAGPGSGKTTVLTCRAAYLMQVEKVRPKELLIVTFTKAAAEEMKMRLAGLPGVGTLRAQSCDSGTFHSIFLRILLRVYGNVPKLLEDWEQRQIIRDLLRLEGQEGNEEETVDVLAKIGICKNNLILPDQIQAKKRANVDFKRRYKLYETWKQQNNRWDYDDILLECHRLLSVNADVRREWANKYRHILVDEFQDTNYVQYEILKILSANAELCIVGDDDQSIYRFRGSRVDYLLSFHKQFPSAKKVVLSTNYRSTEPIVHIASSLIDCNKKREQKRLSGTGRQGEPPVLEETADEREEAVSVLKYMEDLLQTGEKPDDIAVLYRTRLQTQALLDEMVKQEVPFCLKDSEGHFYLQWQVRDILAYFKLALNPHDLDSLVQILNRPKRYIQPEVWMSHLNLPDPQNQPPLQRILQMPALESWKRNKLEELAWDLKKIAGMSPREALRFIRKQIGYDRYLREHAESTGQNPENVFESLETLEQSVLTHATLIDFLDHVRKVNEAVKQAKGSGSGIQLMTFHKAKGLEFKTVIVIGLVNGIVPHKKSLQDKNQEEALEEERRLFYVAITRAKERLRLFSPKKYKGEKRARSPFLDEISVTKR
ncbi:ATP-dependent helicase [Effusibacillus lacus]|uniref:DNA 3'-5' helicase n=1 Tax=Effusibacillus lacus TaxID=1348429 RepID=A0A292YQC3_9BACL|nr:ATP-dependent helicase [Effusibacillus lacus]TCS73204.1 DNA helicase-2/ATP-dependent DNA helicase PcrA [Effusibacillus lacus]GAX90604.1 hypothetical protein EFBL_2232 [Effusibacillus lacus]